MDNLCEVHGLRLSGLAEPRNASKPQRDAYQRATAARERAEAALLRAHADLNAPMRSRNACVIALDPIMSDLNPGSEVCRCH